MDKIDQEIDYYESLLGIDTENPQQKRQFESELEIENMAELFHCVDGILADAPMGEFGEEPELDHPDIMFEDGGEEDPSVLQKRKVVKEAETQKNKLEKKLKREQMTKFGLVMDFEVTKDNIRDTVVKYTQHINDFVDNGSPKKYEEISRQILRNCYFLKNKESTKTKDEEGDDKVCRFQISACILSLISANHGRYILGSFLSEILITFEEVSLSTEHLKSRIFILSALYQFDLISPHFLTGYLMQISNYLLGSLKSLQESEEQEQSEEETTDLITSFVSCYMYLIMKPIRKRDAGNFLEVEKVLSKFFTDLEEIISQKMMMSLEMTRNKFRKVTHNLQQNLNIASHDLDLNSFILNLARKKVNKVSDPLSKSILISPFHVFTLQTKWDTQSAQPSPMQKTTSSQIVPRSIKNPPQLSYLKDT